VQLVVQKKQQEQAEKDAEMDQLQAGIAALKVQQQQQQLDQERQRRKEEDKRHGKHEKSLNSECLRRRISSSIHVCHMRRRRIHVPRQARKVSQQ